MDRRPAVARVACQSDWTPLLATSIGPPRPQPAPAGVRDDVGAKERLSCIGTRRKRIVARSTRDTRLQQSADRSGHWAPRDKRREPIPSVASTNGSESLSSTCYGIERIFHGGAVGDARVHQEGRPVATVAWWSSRRAVFPSAFCWSRSNAMSQPENRRPPQRTSAAVLSRIGRCRSPRGQPTPVLHRAAVCRSRRRPAPCSRLWPKSAGRWGSDVLQRARLPRARRSDTPGTASPWWPSSRRSSRSVGTRWPSWTEYRSGEGGRGGGEWGRRRQRSAPVLRRRKTRSA